MATFDKSIRALTGAYLSGIMAHGLLYAGAAGCIMNPSELRRMKEDMGDRAFTSTLQKANVDASVLEQRRFKVEWRSALDRHGAGRKQVQTQKRYGGYTAQELHSIEEAFNSYNKKSDPDCFCGMTAVFNVLCVIHGVEL